MIVNIFPTMFLALVAHAILRVGFGLILIVLGVRHLSAKQPALTEALMTCVPSFPRLAPWFAVYVGLVEIVLGLMFVAGAYTQIAALITIVYALKLLYLRKQLTYPVVPSPFFFVLAIFVSVSLFITGAGAFAVDIPL